MKVLAGVDFWAGVMFAAFGGCAIYVAQSYPLGTASRMGPAYFPIALGLILAAIGAVLVLTSIVVSGPRVKPPIYRPLIVLLTGVVLFGLTIDWIGLVASSVILIFFSRFASFDFKLREVGETLLLSFVLVVLSLGLFVYGLGLPFMIHPF